MLYVCIEGLWYIFFFSFVLSIDNMIYFWNIWRSYKNINYTFIFLLINNNNQRYNKHVFYGLSSRTWIVQSFIFLNVIIVSRNIGRSTFYVLDNFVRDIFYFPLLRSKRLARQTVAASFRFLERCQTRWR